MKERTVDIRTPDGEMETFITHPEQDGPFPPVVLYMDFWGVREELYDIARRVATVGYYCAVPDLHYRQGKIRFEFRDESGRMISLKNLDEKTQKRVLEPLGKLSNAMAMSDTATLLEFMDAGEPVRPGTVGSLGYCLGGRHVLCASGHFPERFRAGASLHGTNLVSDADDSPHHLADRFRGELYCGFAEHDPYASLPMVEQLAGLLAPVEVDFRYEIHPGAEHGYALPNRDICDKHAMERDWELIFAMFHRQIPPYVGEVAR